LLPEEARLTCLDAFPVLLLLPRLLPEGEGDALSMLLGLPEVLCLALELFAVFPLRLPPVLPAPEGDALLALLSDE